MIKDRGSVTVFLSIILLSVLSLSLLLLEVIRGEAGNNKVKLMSDNSTYSAMTHYNKELKDHYGIYAYTEGMDSFRQMYGYYMEQNNDRGYGITITNVDIELREPLEDIGVLESQILMHMKYRFATREILDFMEKADMIKKTTGLTKTFKKKLAYEKSAGDIAESGTKLYEFFTGNKQSILSNLLGFDYSKRDAYIDNFNSEGFDDRLETIIDDMKSLRDIEDDDIREMEYESIVRTYRDTIKRLKRYNELFRSIDSTLSEVEEDLTSLEALKKEYQDIYDKNKGAIEDFELKDLQLISIDFITDNDIDSIREMNRNNIKNTDRIISSLDGISIRREYNSLRSIIDEIAELNMPSFIYNLKEGDKRYKKYDSRGKAAGIGNKLLKPDSTTESITKKIYNALPSQTKITFKNKYNIEFTNKESDSGFSEESFSALESMFNRIDLKNSRDKLIITEYVLQTFKHRLSIDAKELDSRYTLKSSRSSLFKDSEVEYVLGGNKEREQNLMMIKSEILLIRFGCNAIHAFTCKTKLELAESTALAVGGLFTGGAGIPIIRSFILLGWSMAESIYDVRELTTISQQGTMKDIPLLKSEEQWMTKLYGKGDITIEDKEKDVDYGVSLNYRDYLRLLLLIQDKDVTLKRIQDLLILNIGISKDNPMDFLKNCKTSVEIASTGYIDYLFIDGFNKDIFIRSMFRY